MTNYATSVARSPRAPPAQRKTFAIIDPKRTNEAILQWSRTVPTAPAKTGLHTKSTIKTKKSRFDSLVARYYHALYSFASRLTDDPREALMLADDAFDSTLKQLPNCRDENVFASILIASVIRTSKQLNVPPANGTRTA
jgi:hypothetical protein